MPESRRGRNRPNLWGTYSGYLLVVGDTPVLDFFLPPAVFGGTNGTFAICCFSKGVVLPHLLHVANREPRLSAVIVNEPAPQCGSRGASGRRPGSPDRRG
jgi:hypothetical protein